MPKVFDQLYVDLYKRNARVIPLANELIVALDIENRCDAWRLACCFLPIGDKFETTMHEIALKRGLYRKGSQSVGSFPPT